VLLFVPGAAVLPASAAEAKPGEIHLSTFELSDQFGKLHTIAFPRPRPLLLLVADRRGVDEIDGWITCLKSRWETTADILGIADVNGVPRMFRQRMSDAIRKSRSRPVMLDFDANVTGLLPCRSRTANLFVVDRSGVVVTTIAGSTNLARLNAVRDALERLAPVPVRPPP
jgi:hypothetical protein